MGSSDSIAVTFHGVRGSTPCNSPEISRYGGNTSCVSVAIPGHDPILFDMGTGLRYYGAGLSADAWPFRGSVLLSHLHWDHTQGLPFFTPILCSGAEMTIYGPRQDDGRSVGDVLLDTIKPPLFPIKITEFPGHLQYRDVGDDDFVLAADAQDAGSRDDSAGPGEVTVKSRLIPHVGRTCGYRVTWHGRSVTYMSDHQMPIDGSMAASDAALELAAGADLLIHDSQYTDAEFANKRDWGHCTIDYAVWLAAEAGAKQLALFHHDPTRSDDALDALFRVARDQGERRGVEVVAAAEGLSVLV